MPAILVPSFRSRERGRWLCRRRPAGHRPEDQIPQDDEHEKVVGVPLRDSPPMRLTGSFAGHLESAQRVLKRRKLNSKGPNTWDFPQKVLRSRVSFYPMDIRSDFFDIDACVSICSRPDNPLVGLKHGAPALQMFRGTQFEQPL